MHKVKFIEVTINNNEGDDFKALLRVDRIEEVYSLDTGVIIHYHNPQTSQVEVMEVINPFYNLRNYLVG